MRVYLERLRKKYPEGAEVECTISELCDVLSVSHAEVRTVMLQLHAREMLIAEPQFKMKWGQRAVEFLMPQ